MVVGRTLATQLKDCLLFVDRRIVVVNKPPGLVCQPSVSNQNSCNHLLHAIKRELGQDILPYLVHRLDKPTTGALVLARDIIAARELSRQFQAREVGKSYLALVRGGAQSFKGRVGEIHAPLQINNGRVSLSPNAQGKPAVTGWEVLASSAKAPVSLLKLRLHTGLKHQIRSHLAEYLKTPILGDTLFSHSQPVSSISKATDVPDDRLFLHSYELSFFRYRRRGLKKRFRLGIFAPLPTDFLKVCADLEIQVGPNEMRGGVSIDGVKVDEENGLSEIDGKWMPIRHPQ